MRQQWRGEKRGSRRGRGSEVANGSEIWEGMGGWGVRMSQEGEGEGAGGRERGRKGGEETRKSERIEACGRERGKGRRS